MNQRSEKVRDGEEDFKAVYDEVDARSGGLCEVSIAQAAIADIGVAVRCPKRAAHHHHLFKPRRSNHRADVVVHICAEHHDRVDWPFKRGRLCYMSTLGGIFLFAIRFANDKWEAGA